MQLLRTDRRKDFREEFPSRDHFSSLVCSKSSAFEWLSDLVERENCSVVKYCKGNNQSLSETVIGLVFFMVCRCKFKSDSHQTSEVI